MTTEGNTMFATLTKPQGNYASFTFAIGLMQVEMALATVARPAADKGAEFTYICPKCTEPHKVEQFYRCGHDESHGPFKTGDLPRALKWLGEDLSVKEAEATLVPFADEEIELARFGAIKEPNEKPLLEFRVHPADQVLPFVRPGNLQYRVRPRNGAPAKEKGLYAALAATVAAGDVVWLARGRIRDSQAIFRLEVWHGQLFLSEVMLPSEIAPVDEEIVALDADATSAGLLSQLVEQSVEDFDIDVYRPQVLARVTEAAKAKLAGTAPALEVPSEPDLEAMLAASVEAAGGKLTTGRTPRPRKAPAKRTPAKKKAPTSG